MTINKKFAIDMYNASYLIACKEQRKIINMSIETLLLQYEYMFIATLLLPALYRMYQLTYRCNSKYRRILFVSCARVEK